MVFSEAPAVGTRPETTVGLRSPGTIRKRRSTEIDAGPALDEK
jgi:hypothetical protein